MKWRGCFLFFLLSFYFVAAARGQLISFSVKDEQLEKVFLLIEQQSGHHFIYSDETIAKAKPVTLTVTNEELTTVLDKCFSGQPLGYKVNEKNITVKEKKTVVADHVLRGKVLDQNGNPVSGVTINIKGTPLIVASDMNGEFGFKNAPLNVVLVLTSVEIEPLERFVGNMASVEIRVRIKVDVLDETLVIAYGKSSRRYALGSVNKVSKEEISRQPVSNLLGAMVGRVAGLQITQASGVPGSPFTIRLRGQNSIANGNNPLFIIDGIPFPATSINGLATGGFLASPLNNINIADIESIEVLKDAEATAIYGSRGANGVILITTKKGAVGKTQVYSSTSAGVGRVTRFMDLLKTPQYLTMRREGMANDGIPLSPAFAPDLLVWDTTKNTDWQRELIGRTMRQFDSRVEVSGGTPQTQFLAGFTHRKESMVVPMKEFGEEKTGGQLSLQHHTSDRRISLGLQTSFMKTRLFLPQSDPSVYIVLPPNAPDLHNEDGSLHWDPYWGNALQPLLRPVRTETDNLLVSATLSAKIMEGLEGKVSFGYNLIGVQEWSRTPRTSYNPVFNAGSSASFGTTRFQNLITEPQISYNRKWGKFTSTLLAGISIQDNLHKGLYQTGTGYTDDELLGSIRTASVINNDGEINARYRYTGFFSRITLDYQGRYLLSLTGRRDGSSRYAPQNRFANFGSAALGWIFTKERWFSRIPYLSFGKLRATIGTTGNDQIGDYKYLDTYSPYQYRYQGTTPFIPTQLYSPTYGWEKVNKRELAIDLGFFKERLLVTVNYYNNSTNNQLVSYALPSMTGFTGILKNLPAKVSNYGWEFEVLGVPLKCKSLTWSASFNLSIPRNKLLAFDNIKASSYANTYVVGQSLLIAKRYHLIGVDPATGVYTFQDYNRDGQINTADRQSVVQTGQQFYGNLQNSVSWKNLTLGFLLQFVRHRNAVTYLNQFDIPGSISNQPSLVMNRWQKPGDNFPIQRFAYWELNPNLAFANLNISDGAFDDASFIRLKNLYINWSPFKNHLHWKSLQNMTVVISGQNLFTITRYNSLDPETKSLLPPVRIIIAGLQLTL